PAGPRDGSAGRRPPLRGPAGAGKTRLAAALAATSADPVVFVPLASVAEPGLVPSAVAQALGGRGAAGRPLRDGVVERLARGTPLLVLDNFEHVLPAAAF